MLEQEWWKLLGQQTRQSPMIVSDIVAAPAPKSTQARADIPFTAIGQAVGAAIGFTSYVWTYPIVWIDGPLPIVDTLWIGGLAMATARGARMGRDVGKRLDTIEEVLL
jgi:hypothetical protein